MAEFITTTLMDGYAGGPHITETQLGLANQATFGSDDYVLEGGRESEAQVLTNNSIRIFDAVYCIQGRRDVIPASGYTDVTIANGTQGMNRNDIIVRRYKKDESSEIESTEYAVIKGTPNAGTAVDPEVTTGDIRSGATLHEMALYRVKITGLNITAVEPMFNILKNMASLQKEFAELNSKITILNKPNGNGSALRVFDATENLTYGCWQNGLFRYGGYYGNGAPSDWAGIMLVSPIYINGEVNGFLKVAWDMSMTQYIMKNNKDGSVAQSWAKL